MNSTALQPLSGRRIAITRASEQASDLVDSLRALGAEPILLATAARSAAVSRSGAVPLGSHQPAGAASIAPGRSSKVAVTGGVST